VHLLLGYYQETSWAEILWFYGLLGALALTGAAFTIIKEKIEVRRWQTERCSHGVRGAKHDTKLCKICDAEHERQMATYKHEQEVRKQKEAADELRRYNELVAKIRLPEFLRKMDPEAFETLICRLFGRMGYQVKPTPYVGDNGSDGYLFKGSEKIVLQCKRVQGSVGEPVLRDLFGTMHANQCTNAIVVTTGSVSKQARAWVTGKPIQIIECEELQSLLHTHFEESSIIPADFSATGLGGKPCPRCGKPLRLVKGRNGVFIGCTGYATSPRCHYTSDVDEHGMPKRKTGLRTGRFRRRY
jgi:restriction endonuclease Mrr